MRRLVNEGSFCRLRDASDMLADGWCPSFGVELEIGVIGAMPSAWIRYRADQIFYNFYRFFISALAAALKQLWSMNRHDEDDIFASGCKALAG
jgi:hypothetical protein